MTIGILTLTAGLLLVGDTPADAAALQGTWEVVSQQRAGRPVERPKNMRWIIEGDTIWLSVGRKTVQVVGSKDPNAKPVAGGPGVKSGKLEQATRGLRMTYKLDPTAAQPRIDLDGPKKASYRGIYRLDGDEVTVCVGVSLPSPAFEPEKAAADHEATRPAAFSPEAGTVVVLRRVRP